MKSTHALKKSVLVAAAVVGFAGVAFADSTSKSHTVGFGNKDAGASATFTASAKNTSNSAEVKLDVSGNVNILGSSPKVVGASAGVKNSKGTLSASYALEVAGYTVSSGSKSSSFSWKQDSSYTLASVSATVFVGPVPVTAKGTVGAKGGAAVTLNLKTTEVELKGSTYGAATGSISAKVGSDWVVSITTKADLTLLKTSLNPSFKANFSKLSGNVKLVRDPMTAKISLAIKSLGITLYTKTLAEYSSSSSTTTLISK